MAAKPDTGKKKRALVVYYSKTGNTRAVARHIHDLVGGDMVELVPVDPYPKDYTQTTQQAKRELESGYKPPLESSIDNLDAYDVVFVGSPNWWSTVAGPVKTFLSESDLSGKTVAPFVTHEGSGLGRSVTDIVKWCSRSSVTQGLAVRGHRAASAQGDVAAWLRALGLPK